MASSDPLSSPSPSPPPLLPQPPTRARLSSGNKSTAQQLDTSSELSELTDEDVDADKATPPSEEDEDDPDDSKGDTPSIRPAQKGSRRPPSEHKWEWSYKRKRRKNAEQDGDIDDDPEDEEGEEEEEEEEEEEQEEEEE